MVGTFFCFLSCIIKILENETGPRFDTKQFNAVQDMVLSL